MKQLTLNQQLALMPVSIPDTLLDFLEDFNNPKALLTDSAKDSLDLEYFRKSGEKIKADLEELRAAKGKVLSVRLDSAGKDIPGAYFCQLTCEQGECGIGFLTKLKEKTIYRIILQTDAYTEFDLRQKLKN